MITAADWKTAERDAMIQRSSRDRVSLHCDHLYRVRVFSRPDSRGERHDRHPHDGSDAGRYQRVAAGQSRRCRRVVYVVSDRPDRREKRALETIAQAETDEVRNTDSVLAAAEKLGPLLRSLGDAASAVDEFDFNDDEPDTLVAATALAAALKSLIDSLDAAFSEWEVVADALYAAGAETAYRAGRRP